LLTVRNATIPMAITQLFIADAVDVELGRVVR
jgi:hypothetical protein